MTEYTNPELPDDVNVSKTHPLAEFARLSAGLVLVTVTVLVTLMLAADYFAKYIPFSAEVKVARQFDQTLPHTDAISTYLRSLADKLERANPLPEGMQVNVRYSSDDVTNAFATLGGNIVVYRGLLKRVSSENALAMVLAHEIAHVKLRHPVSAMGRGVVLGVAVGSISAATGSDIASRVLGSAGLLTALSFNRSQESDADVDGLAAVAKLYGHVNGADEVFLVMQNELAKSPAQAPEFLRTHPLEPQRIEDLHLLAQRKGWSLGGELTPLPDDVSVLVASSSD